MFARLLLGLFFLSCLWLEIHSKGAQAVPAMNTAVQTWNLDLEPSIDPPARNSGPKSWLAAGSDALVTKAVVWENARRLERQKRQANFP
jgi:hypothetical protein